MNDSITLVIDRPNIRVSEKSVVVEFMGGSLWLPRKVAPQAIRAGSYASATLGATLHSARVNDRSVTVIYPHSITVKA